MFDVDSFLKIVAGLGAFTIASTWLLAAAIRLFKLRRWRNFNNDLEDWAKEFVRAEDRHPDSLDDDEWRAECATLLNDAKYTASEISSILDLAIIVAKAATVDVIITRSA